MRGTSFGRANVTIGETQHSRIRAVIVDNQATLTERNGTLIRTMPGPITVTNITQQGATWSNGTETWQVRKAGCNCRGNQ